MNTILQKRIEEAAVAIAPFNRMSQKRDYFVKGCEWMLKNQWISVEEALPEEDFNDGYKFVFVRIKIDEDTFIFDLDYIRNKKWELHPNANVTHWMEIPSMKGGEK